MEKIKAWFSATGLTNLGWAAGFATSLFVGWGFAAGACAGIFVYVNFNVIKKLIEGIKK